MPLKWHICQFISVQIWYNYVHIYTILSDEVPTINFDKVAYSCYRNVQSMCFDSFTIFFRTTDWEFDSVNDIYIKGLVYRVINFYGN